MLNETYRAMLNNKSVIRETFMYGRQRAAQIGNENVFDYSLGNPSVPCPPEFTEAMQTLLAQEEPVSLHGYCPSPVSYTHLDVYKRQFWHSRR